MRFIENCADIETAGGTFGVWYRGHMKQVTKKSNGRRSQPAAMARPDRRVGPDPAGWIVTKAGSNRPSGTYGTQAEAARAAQDMVRIKDGTVRIQGPDGRLRESFTIGRDAFAKISAVEGLRLSREMKQDLMDFDHQGLSNRERGQAIVKKYGGIPG